MQRSALQVASFQGPTANSNTSSSNGTASNATNSDSAPRASASQLASIYVLPRAFSLAQLAALDGQVVQTQAGEQWQLSVHAAPSSSVSCC